MPKPKGPPLWAVDAVKRVSRGMTAAQRRMAPAPAVLIEMTSSVWRPYALWTVAELAVADELVAGPRSADELARSLGCDADALRRVLAPLAYDGVFDRPAPGVFALNRLSQPLRSDHPLSVRQTIRQAMGERNRRSCGELLEVVRSGEPAFPRLHGGKDLWTWFAEDALEEGQIFHDSMAELTRLSLPLVLAAHDFSHYGSVLDVGGGQGTLMAGLLAAYPDLHGGVLDLAEALSSDALRSAGVDGRCELIEGSLFGDIPRGWGAYVLKHILHGASPTELRDILGKLREALTSTARLVVMEYLVPESPDGVYPAHLDLQMLVANHGRERTISEYRELFAENGLRLDEVARTASPLALLIVSRA